MEFNVLPRAKILSPQAVHKTNQTTNQTVNVILPQAESKPNESTPPADNPYQAIDSGTVQYKDREVKLDEPAEKLTAEDSTSTINFLKLLLQSYMSNPIKFNGYVICSIPVLEHLIETLTSCDSCDIEVNDVDAGCCGTSTRIIPINKIWVRNGETTEIFKYRYSQFLQVFEQYRISLKFVYVD